MRKVVCLLMGFLVLQGCSREYIQETIRVYHEGGVTFDLNIIPKVDILGMRTGPDIRLIVENKSGQDLCLLDVKVRIYDYERLFDHGFFYTNGRLEDDEPLPLIMPDQSSYESPRELPDPSPFEPGKIPASVNVKYQMDGVDVEIKRSFEITVK